jgi:hypothetical protein
MRIAFVDLRDEARAEVERLTNARLLRHDGDDGARDRLEGDAAWIAVTKRTNLKRALDGRICLVYRVAFEDAACRVAASRLVPVLVEVTRPAHRGSVPWLSRLLREAAAIVPVMVEAECETWRREVLLTASAFASARLQRALSDVAEKRRHEQAQPGLFDRRAERWRDIEAAADAEAERAAKARVRSIEAAAEIVAVPPRLMLVLTPRS